MFPERPPRFTCHSQGNQRTLKSSDSRAWWILFDKTLIFRAICGAPNCVRSFSSIIDAFTRGRFLLSSPVNTDQRLSTTLTSLNTINDDEIHNLGLSKSCTTNTVAASPSLSFGIAQCRVSRISSFEGLFLWYMSSFSRQLIQSGPCTLHVMCMASL